MDYKELIYNGVPISFIILGLVQIYKGIGMAKKFAPLLSLGLGILIGGIAYYGSGEKDLIFLGLLSGLIASGVFSNIKEGANIVRGK